MAINNNNVPEPDDHWILLVEDDVDLRMSTSMMIQEHGVKVISAGNGLEAIKVMIAALHVANMPLMIILDLNMPLLNGWELLDLIEVAEPKIKDIPVVVTSGERMPELNPHIRTIKKPYTADQIMEEIGRVLPTP